MAQEQFSTSSLEGKKDLEGGNHLTTHKEIQLGLVEPLTGPLVCFRHPSGLNAKLLVILTKSLQGLSTRGLDPC